MNIGEQNITIRSPVVNLSMISFAFFVCSFLLILSKKFDMIYSILPIGTLLFINFTTYFSLSQEENAKAVKI